MLDSQQRMTYAGRMDFHANEIDIGMRLCNADQYIAIAKADLQPGRGFAAKVRRQVASRLFEGYAKSRKQSFNGIRLGCGDSPVPNNKASN